MCFYVLHKTSLEGISRRSRAVTAKKLENKCIARQSCCFADQTYYFFYVLVAVAVAKLQNLSNGDGNEIGKKAIGEWLM